MSESKAVTAQQVIDLFSKADTWLVVDQEITDPENHESFYLFFEYRGTEGRPQTPTLLDNL